MGHHAQYRKRGTHTPTLQTITAPPAPTLSDEGSSVFVQATGGNDVGGTLRIEKSPDGNAPWTTQVSTEWSPQWSVQDFQLAKPGYYRALEVGNGLNYLGTSPPSATLHKT